MHKIFFMLTISMMMVDVNANLFIIIRLFHILRERRKGQICAHNEGRLLVKHLCQNAPCSKHVQNFEKNTSLIFKN